MIFLGYPAPLVIPETARWFGVYVHGEKYGYEACWSQPGEWHGQQVTESILVTDYLNGGYHRVDTLRSEADGRPIWMTTDSNAYGTVTHREAAFGPKTIEVAVTKEGQRTAESCPFPEGRKAGIFPEFRLPFDPTKTDSPQKLCYLGFHQGLCSSVDLIPQGKATVHIDVGKDVILNKLIERQEDIDFDAFFDDQGNLIREDSDWGQTIFAEDRKEALSKAAPVAFTEDTARVARVFNLTRTDRLSDLKLEFKASHLDEFPTDDHQSTTKTPEGWIVDVHPAQIGNAIGATIAAAAASQPEWLKPTEHVTSDNPRLIALARKIVGGETRTLPAFRLINKFVLGALRYDYSAVRGRIPDAAEILDSHCGVCLDYAILTAALARAAGIPTRLVAGMVTWDGDFYGHEWVAVFDGDRWIGLESTAPFMQVNAGYVETAVEGEQEPIRILDQITRASVTVVSQTRR